MLYAGFWIRFSAFVIDTLVLVPIAAIFGVVSEESYGIASLLNVVIGWLYGALFESGKWQATPGKKVLGLQVTDLNGQRISFGRATGRHFAKWITGCTLGIGYLMIIWTERKQALHDKIAGTLVLIRFDGHSVDKMAPLSDFSNTELVVTNTERVASKNRLVLAGFDSGGHVVRVYFDADDPRLLISGLIIGRDASTADVHIKDSSISRRHARLFKQDGEIWLEDLSSTNGIFINGKKVEAGSSAPLPLKGTLTIGGIIFSIGRD